MASQDYILRQAEDFARILAYLLGLAKKGELFEAIEFVENALETNYGLKEDFSREHIEKLVREGHIRPSELTGVGELLELRAECKAELGEDANAYYLHARQAMELGMELTGLFSLEMQAKIDRLRLLTNGGMER